VNKGRYPVCFPRFATRALSLDASLSNLTSMMRKERSEEWRTEESKEDFPEPCGPWMKAMVAGRSSDEINWT
jgi:hypothetical protein